MGTYSREFFNSRGQLMDQIEQEDVKQLKADHEGP